VIRQLRAVHGLTSQPPDPAADLVAIDKLSNALWRQLRQFRGLGRGYLASLEQGVASSAFAKLKWTWPFNIAGIFENLKNTPPNYISSSIVASATTHEITITPALDPRGERLAAHWAS
jgi:hypothetical protein